MSEIVLSGIRATGRLHFGNFMGAVQHFVKFQTFGNKCLYFIADVHTLTTLRKPEELRSNVLEIVKDYLAAGLDPRESIIYAQSSIPEIFELCVLLGNVQPLGRLLTTPSYKDMVRRYPDNVNLGTVTYPVLMAADILGPGATLVPVGEDQRPNVELARDLAEHFNKRYGDTFLIPKLLDESEMVKIPGLDGDKMGKSDADNAIDINSSIEVIRERYRRRGITDPQKLKLADCGDPYNRCRSVYPLHSIITEGERETHRIADECIAGKRGCAACKDELVDSIAKILVPFQERRAKLANQDDYVRDILHEGGVRARMAVGRTISTVRQKMGIVVY